MKKIRKGSWNVLKFTFILLIITMVNFILPQKVTAAIGGTCGENLTWELDDDGMLTISGTGDMEDYVVNSKPWEGEEEQITSVKISEGVTSIGAYAFYECINLGSIEIPSEVTSIGDFAFCGCESLSSIEIPSGVTSIEDYAFSGCINLGSVEIPSGVTSIKEWAFSGCINLESIEIPSGVTSIEYATFYGCSSLSDIEIPSGVTSIGYAAFSFCSSLKSVKIPSGVTSIGCRAFNGCTNLRSIEIPSGVMSIDIEAFWDVPVIHNLSSADGSPWGAMEVHNCTLDDCQICKGNNDPFIDIQEDTYYYEPVLWAVKEEITSGVSKDRFGPEENCTRGQVVTFLWRTMGCPEPTISSHTFVDVHEGDYFYKPVLWAVENGITSGTDNTHFTPNANVTRGQFVTFLYRAKEKPVYENKENPFVDLVKGPYYYDPILWAVENKITSGINANHFGPENNCTRGQVVTFLYRAYALS